MNDFDLKISMDSFIDVLIENKDTLCYIIRNANYRLYSDYELNHDDYYKALLFKDLANFSEEILIKILKGEDFNNEYLKSKLVDFIRRLS